MHLIFVEAFVSMIEPKNIKEAIIYDNWIIAMQEELNQFERNNVWKLVEKPENRSIPTILAPSENPKQITPNIIRKRRIKLTKWRTRPRPI